MNIIKIVWQTARTITNEILAGRVLLYLFIYLLIFFFIGFLEAAIPHHLLTFPRSGADKTFEYNSS